MARSGLWLGPGPSLLGPSPKKARIVQERPPSTMLGLWSATQGGPYTPIPAVLLFTGRDS